MASQLRNPSPEVYLAGAVVISLVLAAILTQIPAFAFGGFVRMAAVLVVADLALYVLMKLGAFGSRSNGRTG